MSVDYLLEAAEIIAQPIHSDPEWKLRELRVLVEARRNTHQRKHQTREMHALDNVLRQIDALLEHTPDSNTTNQHTP